MGSIRRWRCSNPCDHRGQVRGGDLGQAGDAQRELRRRIEAASEGEGTGPEYVRKGRHVVAAVPTPELGLHGRR